MKATNETLLGEVDSLQRRERAYQAGVLAAANAHDAAVAERDEARRQRDGLAKALESIRDYYGKEWREGEKAYQAVIIAESALEATGL